MKAPVVAVFGIDLAITANAAARLATCLDDAERQRIGTLRFESDRLSFIAAHAGLRHSLASHLCVSPAALALHAPTFEKPRLLDYPHCHFNLSHSGTMALVAICDSGPVGVDLERVRELDDMEAVARQVFIASERAALRSAAAADRAQVFYRGWTRKEALIKATGEGFRADLSRIGVTLTPGTAPQVTHWPQPAQGPGRWQLASLEPQPEYIAAVACQGVAPPGLTLHDLPRAVVHPA